MTSLSSMLLLVVLLVVFMYSIVTSWEQEITVDWENGTDNQSCLQGDVPCASFNMALNGITNNSTVIFIYISSGNYTLENGSECDIIGKDHITIIGSKDTVVRCNPLIGIGICYSKIVFIKSIIFDSCGKPFRSYQAALLIYFNLFVRITNLVFQFSNGTGLSVHLSGNVTVDSCLIADSRILPLRIRGPDPSQWLGGGILLIGVNGFYTIINTTITNKEFKSVWPVASCPAVSGGGIVMADLEWHSVLIDSCTVVNNSRGITSDLVRSSNIVIKDSIISLNQNISVLNVAKGYDDFVLHLIDTHMTDALHIIVYDLPHFYNSTVNGFRGFTLQLSNFELIVSHQYQRDIIYNSVMFKKSPCSNHFNNRGKCSEIKQDYTGHCPVAYSSCFDSFCFCDDNHRGRLCSQCNEGYSVSVNSPYLSCVPCDTQQTVNKGWETLLGLEFVPLTLMVLIIIVLDVNLTQGSLNAYIFLCQILTISFPSVSYPSWIAAKYFFADKNFYYISFSIWNVDWINVLSYHRIRVDSTYQRESTGVSICISSSTTPLGAISFWYIISFYPLLQLIVLYTVVILYNRGYKVLVCWLRPFHRLMARFWRLFDLHPSLSHSVASVYTLCFTQLAATSLKILHPTWYRDDTGNVVTVFFYDGSQRYFQGWHIPAVIGAILVLIGLIIITLYLSLYSQCFQECFVRSKYRRKNFLIPLSDVFMMPYKNGTDNTFDYRCFAGIRFGLMLMIMTFYYIPQNEQTLSIIPILEVTTCSVYASTIIIFRPYKRAIHTLTESVVFAALGLFASSYFFPDPRKIFFADDKSYWNIRLILPVLGIVLIVVILYFLVWFGRKCYHGYQLILSLIAKGSVYAEIEFEVTHSTDEHLADRLINPKDYDSI